MLVSKVSAAKSDPKEIELANFWTDVHSGEAMLDGISLALLIDKPVELELTTDLSIGPVVVAWFEESDAGFFRLVKQHMEVDEFLQIARRVRVEDVVLAKIGLDESLEEFLREIPFSRELKGQVNGFWFETWEELPACMPTYFPTGAVSFRRGNSGVCLDLIPIDYVWYPLSEAAIYTYSHSAGLMRGNKWVFVAADSDNWPTVYSAELGNPVECQEVGRVYGIEIKKRTRQDFLSVQLRLTRQT